MNFKEELLKIKSKSNIPEQIQVLLDNGIINSCETIDGIYYIDFAFLVKNNLIFQYDIDGDLFPQRFEHKEFVDTIYYGGMAIDSDLNVLKGIIYPNYFNIKEDTFLFREHKHAPYFPGVPQIIVKSDETKLTDWFDEDYMKICNILTDDTAAWVDFIKGNELYDHTNVLIGYDDVGCDSTYFGEIHDIADNKKYDNYKIGSIFRCQTLSVWREEVIPLDYVKSKLNNINIEKDIARKIYYTNTITKSFDGISKSIKEGAKDIQHGELCIADSIERFGMRFAIAASRGQL